MNEPTREQTEAFLTYCQEATPTEPPEWVWHPEYGTIRLEDLIAKVEGIDQESKEDPE